MANPHRLIGSFSAISGRRLLEAFEKSGVRFEAASDTRAGNFHGQAGGQASITSPVKLYVHEEDLRAAERILAEQDFKEDRDYFRSTSGIHRGEDAHS